MNITSAKQIDIVQFLKNIGHDHIKQKGHKYWYLSPIRTESTPSFKVDSDRNEWFDYGINKGGDIIDLARHLYNVYTVSEALRCLEDSASTIINRIYRAKDAPPRRQQSNEMRNVQYISLNNGALLSYMMKRKIDIHIGRTYCCEVHYDIKGSHYFGIAFRNRVGGFEIRNQYYKGCVGHKDITIIKQSKEKKQEHCCLFEGFMDFLSYLTLLYQHNTHICIEYECDYIILNTINNINKAIEELEGYKNIHSYLDNDDAGTRTYEALRDIYNEKAIDESIRYKEYNDLNDYLVKHNFSEP